MRIGRLLIPILPVCALICLLSRSACALGSASDIPPDPNKVATPTGLNSVINLSSALLAIDDKSPMATSIGGGEGWKSALGRYLISNAAFRAELQSIHDELQAVKATLRDHQTLAMFEGDNGPGILDKLAGLNFRDRSAVTSLFSDPELFSSTNAGAQAFLNDKSISLQPDTQALLSLKLVGGGIIIRNRLLVRDYVAYLKKKSHELVPLSDPSGITPEEVEWLRKHLPPEIASWAVYTGVQVRTGAGPTAYTPEVIYSSGLGGFDAAAQAYLSDKNGYAGSLRLDLSSGRTTMAHAVSKLQEGFAKLHASLPKARESEVAVLVAGIIGDDPEANRRIVQMQLGLRSSVQVSYRHIDGAGAFESIGASVSQLFPFPPLNPHGGITFLANLQALRFEPTSGASASTIRSGVAVYWQDRVSRLLPDGTNPPIGDIQRWTTQFGVEYSLQNSLQQNDVYGVFLRRRTAHFFEFTVSAGRASNKQGFLGISIGQTFP